METRITSEKHNKIIGRKEVSAEVVYAEAPPKRQEIRESVAKALNTDLAKVVVGKVKNDFGQRTCDVTANAYDNADDVKKYELRYRLVRAGLMEKKQKVVEAPKAAPKKGGAK